MLTIGTYVGADALSTKVGDDVCDVDAERAADIGAEEQARY